MKLISHRGNLNGINTITENRPKQIETVLSMGLDCEVDIWHDNNSWMLGHDKPQFKVSYNWLINHSSKLWIHCKNIEAITRFSRREGGYIWNNNLNYFWHENDKVTLTSRGYIWSFPSEIPINNSIIVLPEKYNTNISKSIGICSDFILKYIT
jgi:hypothetical protein